MVAGRGHWCHARLPLGLYQRQVGLAHLHTGRLTGARAGHPKYAYAFVGAGWENGPATDSNGPNTFNEQCQMPLDSL